VTNLEENLFFNCTKLSTVIIGDKLSSVEYDAFYNCTGLDDIYCYTEDVPQANAFAFNGSNLEKVTLHVPATSLDAYKYAEYWKDFGTIVALTDDDPKPTGIMTIETISNDNNVIYDLNGIRLSEPKTGINIINGKKYVIK